MFKEENKQRDIRIIKTIAIMGLSTISIEAILGTQYAVIIATVLTMLVMLNVEERQQKVKGEV